MSNYDLKAEVSRLESQLRGIERENAQLRSEINSAVNSVNQAQIDLANYNQHIRSTLDNAAGTINNSINRALSAYELQGQIDQLYGRYKCVELANKKIRALNNKKYYDFNNYRTVRKIVQGMMDNLDLDMVNDAMIYKSIEKQHLLTPDFWLTSALISIMAWKADDRQLAEKAVESAVKLDRKNSSIFFMIFNLRMEREEAAVKWFLEYQKCDLKGSDEQTFLMLFSLISKTLSDTVDDETSGMIRDFIQKLIMESAEKEGYSEADVIALITDRMAGMMRSESYEFPLMAKYCQDFGTILKMLNLASNNYNILEFILKIINVPVAERNTYLKEYLNELLAKPNNVERETYDEIEYNELVIRMSGDVEGAKAAFARELANRESEFDIMSSMISWVYDMGNEDINGQMRLNMFTLIKSLQEKAAEAYIGRYRSLYKESHPVAIQDYSAEVNFGNKADEISKAESYYLDQQNHELAQVKNQKGYIAFGAGIVCAGASFFVHPLLLTGLGIGVAAGAGILVMNHFKRKNIILKVQKQKENVIDIMHRMFAEKDRMQELYKGFDSVAESILGELAKL